MNCLPKLLIVFIFFFAGLITNAQQPKYTKKLLRTTYSPELFTVIVPEKNGFGRTYIEGETTLWDVDDANTTHVQWDYTVVMKVEGNYKNGQRDGVFTFSLIDSLDQKKSYKIYEQNFKNDRLNGAWHTYNLRGTLVNTQHFVNDSIAGLARTYWIDGKIILFEADYLNGKQKYIERHYTDAGIITAENTIENGQQKGLQTTYFPNGKPEKQITILNGILEGPARMFYESGTLMEEVNFSNGKFEGLRKYYYPNGKLWIEVIYKEGMQWTVIANYDANGKKRDGGTLKNGTGTLKLYNEDGSVREVVNYVNGKEQ